MPGLLERAYNPDVLSCLANLSNDEVFTPPDVANQMLDMLPQELFESTETTFLDPACKSGIFLREIAKRLIKAQIPDYEDRVKTIQEKQDAGVPLDESDTFFQKELQRVVDNIFKKQLYGIAITELTSLLSRRSVYCSKYPNSEFSITKFDNAEGNIRFRRIEHKWDKTGKCEFCGASKNQYDRAKNLETHAYEWIHTIKPEEIWNMHFDVVISNPPYQLSDGGHGASAVPIYQDFVTQAKKLKPRFLTMIIPARWYVGGRALDRFRDDMLNDKHIRELHDFPNATDCFPGVEIKGGVCYFLWDRDKLGSCKTVMHSGNDIDIAHRFLLEDGMETFIRSPKAISILRKVQALSKSYLSQQLNAGRYFGFHTKVLWNGENGSLQTADGQSSFPVTKEKNAAHNVKVYIAHGICWISENNIPRNKEQINKYKVIIPEAGNPGSTIIGKPIVSEPGSCSSNTYIVMTLKGNSKIEADNAVSYLNTQFVRFLVSLRTTTQHMAPKAYSFVPTQDYSKSWTDNELYVKYGLSQDEIDFIESMIKPME